MKSNLNRLFLAALGALAAHAPLAHAEDAGAYPARAITMIISYSPGAAMDMTGRMIANEMEGLLGKPIAVVNRPGASGVIGTRMLVRAQRDGYTLSFAPTTPLTSEPLRVENIGYGLEDVTAICKTSETYYLVVVPAASPYKTLGDLIAKARTADEVVSAGSAGHASVNHLAAADLGGAAQVTFNHVAYGGDAAMLADLLGGRLDFGVAAVSSVNAHVDSGGVRILASLTEQRVLPAYPTAKELGFDTASASFQGIIAPKGIPKGVKDKLELACREALASPRVQDWAKSVNQVLVYGDGDEFRNQLEADMRDKERILQRIGLLAR
ncbi:tripartite tricarboxylate transporter substrate binding protein [Verticiella sediminum]|uniref:Tripartite tricarboxylate transporter substrate binding protein n=1 Tax=Verticiella sediminum TaxID=1247510 RepID=A0A556A901_9BURK|nr:tripartite tricarboxylate transporter substrate binding protein [Verticiella sediminum]TSH89364.1 tripartite tricarboxylate transporter substrate binding protein [Verticiella sediminum]